MDDWVINLWVTISFFHIFMIIVSVGMVCSINNSVVESWV